MALEALRELSGGALGVAQADWLIGSALSTPPSPAATALLELAEAATEFSRAERNPEVGASDYEMKRYHAAVDHWQEVKNG